MEKTEVEQLTVVNIITASVIVLELVRLILIVLTHRKFYRQI